MPSPDRRADEPEPDDDGHHGDPATAGTTYGDLRREVHRLTHPRGREDWIASIYDNPDADKIPLDPAEVLARYVRPTLGGIVEALDLLAKRLDELGAPRAEKEVDQRVADRHD